MPPVPPAPPVPPVPEVPRYGEYAPGYVPTAQAPARPAPGYESAAYGTQSYPPGFAVPGQPGVRKRKTWDLVLTVIFLVVGFFGMLIAFGYGALLNNQDFLDGVADGANIPGGFGGTVGAQPAIIVISHLILFLAAVGGSIPLLITKRVAFWVPLTAGVIAAIVFWVTFVSVFLSDPNFIAQYS